MAEADARASVATVAPSTLAVTGALVFASAAGAYRQALDLLRQQHADTLDLGGVSRADSAGLGWLLAVLATARQRGDRLRVVNMPEGLRVLAQVCEVEALLA